LHLDDFGTGYSSLSRLQVLPIDSLKIDRSFVRGAQTEGEGSAIAHAVVSLARALGMTKTAEGIETDPQLEVMRRLRCDFGQGTLFSPAVPASEATALLSDKKLHRFRPK
jgi:EAL domain-containing protein (putative c-di-GMP-specific phosphodiesterase class I)